MSNTKMMTLGKWAVPPTNNNTADRPLTGRVIFGMLTGHEGPDVVTSAKKDPRK